MARRRRKRTWGQRAFQYWARAIDEADPPLPIRRAAERAAGLWNQLAAAHAAWRHARADCPPTCGCGLGATWREAEAAWRATARQLAETSVPAEATTPTARNQWREIAADVLTRFEAAVRQAPRRRGRDGAPGWPRPVGDLTQVALVLKRWTSGGRPVSALWNPAATGVALRPVDPAAYRDNTRSTRRARLTRGHIDVLGVRVPIEALLHRPLPPGAILKRALWCGRRAGARWTWSLILQIEEPPASTPLRPGRAEIRFGWAHREGQVCLATVSGDDGREEEVLLPLTPSSRRRARQWGHLFEPSPKGITDIAARIGAGVQAAKERLAPLLADQPAPWPLRDTTREGGLRRRLARLEALGEAVPPPLAEARAVLRAWAAEEQRLRSLHRAAMGWWVRRRRWAYAQVAHWLCRRYGTLVDTERLNFARLARGRRGQGRPADAYALDRGDTYRMLAAPGEFRAILRQTAARTGTRWIEGAEEGGPA